MKVLFDTNIVLDFLFDRKPFSNLAAHLFTNVEEGMIQGYLCATTITTIHYLAAKVKGKEQAERHIHSLMSLFEIAPVHRAVLESALQARFDDFEDAVVCEAAAHIGAEAVVTLILKDFRKSTITLYSPEQLRKIVEQR